MASGDWKGHEKGNRDHFKVLRYNFERKASEK